MIYEVVLVSVTRRGVENITAIGGMVSMDITLDELCVKVRTKYMGKFASINHEQSKEFNDIRSYGRGGITLIYSR